jgi:hypothetical protein
MPLRLQLRHVPWTCRWGRFGGPVQPSASTFRGFVFWVCLHPQAEPHRLLDRGSCEGCPWWEANEKFDEEREGLVSV